MAEDEGWLPAGRSGGNLRRTERRRKKYLARKRLLRVITSGQIMEGKSMRRFIKISRLAHGSYSEKLEVSTKTSRLANWYVTHASQ